MKTTFDGLLSRRVTLEQPVDGYRVAVDTVFLAAAIPAKASERMLDLGCGAGGVMLCVMSRVPGLLTAGLEIQAELKELCKRNIKSNGFETSAQAIQQDVTRLPEDLFGRFDHVAMNPPFHGEARHDVSSDPAMRTANSEKTGDLPKWIDSAARALKDGGVLTLIHRADRLNEILQCLKSGFGTVEILPIVPKTGATAKRVILRAAKDEKKTIYFCRDFVLHKPDGKYTDEAEAVLRDMQALNFTRV